jgi:hypothetical protein
VYASGILASLTVVRVIVTFFPLCITSTDFNEGVILPLSAKTSPDAIIPATSENTNNDFLNFILYILY